MRPAYARGSSCAIIMSHDPSASSAKTLPPAAIAEAGKHSPSAGNGKGARRRRSLQIGLATLLVISVGVLGYWFFFMRGIVFTDDARFGGHLVDLAPEINGRVVEIAFHEGQSVRRSQEVFRLDPSSAESALGQAEAALSSARASLASSTAKCDKTLHGSRPEEIRAGEATVKRLTHEAELARVCYERVQTLLREGSAAQEEYDRARTTYQSAQENLETARQNLALLQQGSRPEDVAAARADLELAQSRVAEASAAVAHARTDLEHCSVKAPFDGWVVRRWLDAGAITPPSQPVVTLFDPATLRVDANVEEKYLHEIKIGDEAEITIDAFPGLHLKGRVTDILRATNSQFSLIPAEGVSGTFIKVTQRVPLRISVSAPADLPLGPGLSAEVKIRVGSADRTANATVAHADR